VVRPLADLIVIAAVDIDPNAARIINVAANRCPHVAALVFNPLTSITQMWIAKVEDGESGPYRGAIFHSNERFCQIVEEKLLPHLHSSAWSLGNTRNCCSFTLAFFIKARSPREQEATASTTSNTDRHQNSIHCKFDWEKCRPTRDPPLGCLIKSSPKVECRCPTMPPLCPHQCPIKGSCTDSTVRSGKVGQKQNKQEFSPSYQVPALVGIATHA
jgi:hypothetical protein